MHTFLYRSNALLTFSITILALICGMASFSDYFHHPSPSAQVQVLNVRGFQKLSNGNDEVQVRVSNQLGRGNAKAAKFAIIVASSTSLFIGIILFFIFVFVRGSVAYVFTESQEVAAEVADLLSPLLALSILLNSVQPVLSGVAVGSGQQSIVAYVNLGSYYLVGIPIGVVLGYVVDMQAKGVWVGMLIGTFVQTIMLAIITFRTDWEKQVIKARQRVSKFGAPISKSSLKLTNQQDDA